MLDNLHLIDIFFVILGCYFIVKGYFRGFIAEVFSLFGLIASLYLSFRFSAFVGAFIERFFAINSYLLRFLAIILIWFLVAALFALIKNALKNVITAINISSLDKILGVFLGLAKTIILVYFVFISGFLLSSYVEPTWMSSSFVLRTSGNHWPKIRQFLVDSDFLPGTIVLPEGTLDEALESYVIEKSTSSNIDEQTE